MEENREQRFKRIAEARTNKIINMIRLLGNCSNRGNYEYSESDVKKIFSAIDNEIKIAKAKFSENDINKKFKL